MVKSWLPVRSARNSIETPSTSDTASVTSDFSQWTGTSTVQIDSEVTASSDEVAFSIHPLPTQDGLIAKITPPTEPVKPIEHVPCDIVLVIDVSGSMGSNAPIPANPGEQAENYGLSVLDLVKHASKTILETLDEGDRLGIVAFASQAKVIQQLIPMNEKNKKATNKNIDGMRPLDATNLWHGLLEGVKLFREGGEENTGRVPAVFVLTDGMPNYMCPPQGYVPKIRGMEQLPASVHTFGFGYSLRSGLLKSIAEIGGGNYAYIPDAGMIGTVFVHAVANLQTTYAINAVLRLTYPAELELEETTGPSVDKQEAITLSDEDGEPRQLSIFLGNLQYGQSRDIYLRVKGVDKVKRESAEIMALLEYSQMTSIVRSKRVTQSFTTPSTLPEAEIAYHVSRSQICSFLADGFPIRHDGEHEALASITPQRSQQLSTLIADLPAQKFANDPKNKSLLEDLSGPEPKGQISLALSKPQFYTKWGIHYLPSLLNAHTRQICNTFKDPGPLQYGADSPLFVACRRRLDNAFDNLPAPKPSNQATATHRGRVNMSSYHNASGVCFAAFTPVQLASGIEVPISSLKKGVSLSTPYGPRCVVAVLKTPVAKEIMCRIGSLVVTPWHPVSLDGGKTWTFPADTAESSVRYTGFIYSVLLQRDTISEAHSIQLANGILGVTLGHGLLAGEDVRAHSFFGDYSAVTRSLKAIGINSKTGIASGAGVKRDPGTGLVNGFKKGKRMMLGRINRLGTLRSRRYVRPAPEPVV